ncbi:hypothetical protein HD599_002113 [Conyzicola lurida]|uniref:Uncharacterized protein n=1 Tax=Conyzicola lurida TaxID=1172621 RepID=A0A841AIS8_9MICO|nr:hypothetical protein [Conyzicola lurida]MBB5843790.1 hypothetical protein [Conyzicola lurida]
MTLLALLLGSVGLADLLAHLGTSRRDRLSPRRRSPRRLWAPAAIGAAAFVAGAATTGAPWGWWPVGAAAVAGWLIATRETARSTAGYWAAGTLAAAIVAAFVWGGALPTPRGPLVDWYDALPYAALADIGFTTFALVVGGAFFLVESANVVVRLALRGERDHGPVDAAAAVVPAAPKRRWWQRGVAPATSTEQPVAELGVVELRGGRFIGPLERLFLLALVLSGQFTAIAALVAAKGIIRFPEISKDAAGGSKAEYFLVGSFASWTLVLLVVLLVALGPALP